MPTSRSTLCLVLIAGAGLLAGCEASVSTGGDTIDSGDAELTIKRQYPGQAEGLKLTEISCGEADAKVDSKFTCTGENDAGVSLDFESTITEVNDDTGKVGFDWTITKATSDGKVYGDAAAENLQRQGYAVTAVECPAIVIEKGRQVDCEATMDDGSKQNATLTLTNGNGGFNVKTSGPLDSSG
ncbi:MAG TPA: hypothetical protein VMF31_13090 [Solirubrobacterales bacterium]|nr:hypothetical protein [Solirubrobacterales bacterium]